MAKCTKMESKVKYRLELSPSEVGSLWLALYHTETEEGADRSRAIRDLRKIYDSILASAGKEIDERKYDELSGELVYGRETK